MFEEISAEARQILQKAYGVEALPLWTVPREKERGDAATAVALSLARELKKKPQEVAETLSKALAALDSIERTEVAGAGYVNIWLTPDALLRELQETKTVQKPKKAKKGAKSVIIEYSQPNIAKPLAIHHIIGTVMGQTLVNLYRHAGFNVISWNYIGDWGTQFGKLAVAHEKWGTGKPVAKHTLDELLALYVRFHEEVVADATLEDQGREAFRKLEKGDQELRAFWKDVVSVTKASLADIYERLHVSFDLDLGESFYEDKMESLLEEGINKGVFTEGEGGALIVEFPEATGMPPYLVRKSDGATLYSTRDLAQMRYRIDTYEPQEILILTDVAQKLHFEQLVESCRMLAWELPTFENVLFGRMRFIDKSMSTRKGNVLHLEHVLDEAVQRAEEIIEEHRETIQTDDKKDLAEMMGIGALVYGILSQNRKMDMVFDWDKMLSFEGNSAPYLQYTHARSRSVLRKAEMENAELPSDAPAFTDGERLLIKTLLLLPDVLREAREMHMPHKLANYLHQLCQDYNAFYNTDPILKAASPERELRLALSDLTSSVLRTGAELLTLRVPERM